MSVYSTFLDIVQGWNWIGFLPEFSMSLILDNVALASLTLEQEDYIKNQTESATYYDIGGWFGSLAELSPTDGYMLKKQSADELNYAGRSSSSTGSLKYASTEIAVLGTSFNPHQFEFSGSVTATVYVEGALAGGENDLILAYVDEELRGISKGLYFEPTSTYAFPIMVYSNMAVGETIGFRYYDADSDQLFSCDETLVFSKDMIVDNAFESFELNVISAVGLERPVGEMGGISMEVYPNPFTDQLHIHYSINQRSKVKLEVVDMLGKVVEIIEVKTLDPGFYNSQWNAEGFPEAAYYLKLTTEDSVLIKRIILIK